MGKGIFRYLAESDRNIGIVLMMAVLIFFLYSTIPANMDLSDGGHMLFMDEMITFKGVKLLLHPVDAFSLIDNIIDGNDHRYGRILWNVSALTSYIPERIAGDRGQIVATRMTQAVVLFLAYFLLCVTFIRNWTIRAFLLLLLTCIPSSAYFMTMPKPEPIQLFFIAVFLFYAKKNEFKPGQYWFFLGMAYGTKITALFLIIFFGAVALFLDKNRIFSAAYLKRAGIAFVFLVAGFLVAEPLFLKIIYTRNLNPVSKYIAATYLNTWHGADDAKVTFLSWLSFLDGIYLKIPFALKSLLYLSLFGVAALFVQRRVRDRELKLGKDYHDNASVLIVLAGAVLIVPIIFRVKRLWDFYLHSGMVLVIVGVIAYCANEIVNSENAGRKASRYLSMFVLAALLVFTFFYKVPEYTSDMHHYATRTQSPIHKQRIKEYEYLFEYLNMVQKRTGNRLMVYYDPKLYLIPSNDRLSVVNFWMGDPPWDAYPDLIVTNSEMFNKMPSRTSAVYIYRANAIMRRNKYVCKDNNPVTYKLCYVKTNPELDSIEIYMRNDIYNFIHK